MSGRFKDKRHPLGDGYYGPSIEFRFKEQDGELWFSLWAMGAKAPIFSGIVTREWGDQLRAIAAEIDATCPRKATE